MPAVSPIFPGISIIDSDTHWSEPADLWTSLAPPKYKDLVPQIREHNGRRKWVVNGDIPLTGDSAVSAIAPSGEKMLGLQFLKHDLDMVHAASYDCDARLELMDRMGVSHGIVYPNVGGFGNQNFLKVEDAALRIACVEIYNDWMSDLQQRSGGRILPMALVPWWDIEACVAEVDRMHKNGAKGIVMCSNPHDSGMPESCGLEHMTMPLAPARCMRSTSATQASMSHQGTSAIGRMRCPDRRCRSFIQSL